MASNRHLISPVRVKTGQILVELSLVVHKPESILLISQLLLYNWHQCISFNEYSKKPLSIVNSSYRFPIQTLLRKSAKYWILTQIRPRFFKLIKNFLKSCIIKIDKIKTTKIINNYMSIYNLSVSFNQIINFEN